MNRRTFGKWLLGAVLAKRFSFVSDLCPAGEPCPELLTHGRGDYCWVDFGEGLPPVLCASDLWVDGPESSQGVIWHCPEDLTQTDAQL